MAYEKTLNLKRFGLFTGFINNALFHETNLFGVGFLANMWLFFPTTTVYSTPSSWKED